MSMVAHGTFPTTYLFVCCGAGWAIWPINITLFLGYCVQDFCSSTSPCMYVIWDHFFMSSPDYSSLRMRHRPAISIFYCKLALALQSFHSVQALSPFPASLRIQKHTARTSHTTSRPGVCMFQFVLSCLWEGESQRIERQRWVSCRWFKKRWQVVLHIIKLRAS